VPVQEIPHPLVFEHAIIPDNFFALIASLLPFSRDAGWHGAWVSWGGEAAARDVIDFFSESFLSRRGLTPLIPPGRLSSLAGWYWLMEAIPIWKTINAGKE